MKLTDEDKKILKKLELALFFAQIKYAINPDVDKFKFDFDLDLETCVLLGKIIYEVLEVVGNHRDSADGIIRKTLWGNEFHGDSDNEKTIPEIKALERIETVVEYNRKGLPNVYRDNIQSSIPFYEDFDLVMSGLKKLAEYLKKEEEKEKC